MTNIDFRPKNGPFTPLDKTRIFLRKRASSLFSVYWTLTSCNKSGKTFWVNLERRTDGQTELNLDDPPAEPGAQKLTHKNDENLEINKEIIHFNETQYASDIIRLRRNVYYSNWLTDKVSFILYRIWLIPAIDRLNEIWFILTH